MFTKKRLEIFKELREYFKEQSSSKKENVNEDLKLEEIKLEKTNKIIIRK